MGFHRLLEIIAIKDRIIALGRTLASRTAFLAAAPVDEQVEAITNLATHRLWGSSTPAIITQVVSR